LAVQEPMGNGNLHNIWEDEPYVLDNQLNQDRQILQIYSPLWVQGRTSYDSKRSSFPTATRDVAMEVTGEGYDPNFM